MEAIFSTVRWALALVLLAGAMSLGGALGVTDSATAAGTGCLPGSIKSKLAQIRSKFGPIKVISTHRPGARIAGSGKRSLHASCRAADFHPPKGKYRQVVAWLKKTHSGGVGTYSCGMHHIHIDNGSRVRFHHCVNAKGRPVGKSRYAKKSKSKKKYVGKSSKKRYAAKSSKKKAKGAAYAAKKKRKVKRRVSAYDNPFSPTFN
ncbi:MAG: D-Ala-D-Ala carboxypeptidase family metallohydrolase [Pseudomonadota bacterium]